MLAAGSSVCEEHLIFDGEVDVEGVRMADVGVVWVWHPQLFRFLIVEEHP